MAAFLYPPLGQSMNITLKNLLTLPGYAFIVVVLSHSRISVLGRHNFLNLEIFSFTQSLTLLALKSYWTFSAAVVWMLKRHTIAAWASIAEWGLTLQVDLSRSSSCYPILVTCGALVSCQTSQTSLQTVMATQLATPGWGKTRGNACN